MGRPKGIQVEGWDKEAHKREILELAQLKGNSRPTDHIVDKCPRLFGDIAEIHLQSGSSLTRSEFLIELLRRVALDEDSGKDVKCFGDVLDVTGITDEQKLDIHRFANQKDELGKRRKSDAPLNFMPHGREMRRMVAAHEYGGYGVTWLGYYEEKFASAFIGSLHDYVAKGKAAEIAGRAVDCVVDRPTGDVSPCTSGGSMPEPTGSSGDDIPQVIDNPFSKTTFDNDSNEGAVTDSAPVSDKFPRSRFIHRAVGAIWRTPVGDWLLVFVLALAVVVIGFTAYQFLSAAKRSTPIGVPGNEPCLARLVVNTPLTTREAPDSETDAPKSPKAGFPCPQFFTGIQTDSLTGKKTYTFAVPDWANFVDLKASFDGAIETDRVDVVIHLKGDEAPADGVGKVESLSLKRGENVARVDSLQDVTTIEIEISSDSIGDGYIVWDGWYTL